MTSSVVCGENEDNKLVALSKIDSRYFYCLMIRYEEKLTRYVKHISYMPDEDVADVLQESFIKAYSHLNDFDDELKFSSWIYRIVHNQTINTLKKLKQSVQVNIDESADDFSEWLTADLDIEAETIKKYLDEDVMGILNLLKPEYKEILILRFYEDKNYEEIGDILEIPMGTVATKISRAKIQFKQLYEKIHKS